MFHVRVDVALSAGDNGPNVDDDISRIGDTAKDDSISFSVGRANFDSVSGVLRLYRQHGIEPWDCLGKSRTLLIIAIPSLLSPTDFASWLGSFTACIEHMRFIREPSHGEHRFAVLLRFSSVAESDRFFRAFQGKRFTSLSPETCRVLCVAAISLPEPDSSSRARSERWLRTDPLVAHPDALTAASADVSEGIGQGSDAAAGAAALTELPTCPVCLERLDSSVSGVLTTLCDHSFHCACLAGWRMGDTCPVCRYCMSADEGEGGEEGGVDNREEEQDAPGADGKAGSVWTGGADLDSSRTAHVLGTRGGRVRCEICGTREHLWMCLLCGNVGCGRYSAEHAMAHYRASGHTYAVEVGVGRVWDYASDGYVHRLIQNKADGKLVELPDVRALHQTWGASTGTGPGWSNPSASLRNGVEASAEGGDAGGGGPAHAGHMNEKLDSVAFEYTMLLTSQLESQRSYFDGMLSSLLSLLPADGPVRREAEALLFAQGHGVRIVGAGEAGSQAVSAAVPSPAAAADKGSPSSGTCGHSLDRRRGGVQNGAGTGSAPPPPALTGKVDGQGASDASYTGAHACACNTLKEQVDELCARISALQARLAEADARLSSSERERKAALRSAASARDTLDTVSEELAFLRDVNDSLTGDSGKWRARVAELETALGSARGDSSSTIAELEEQVRDLMFTLTAGDKMSRAMAGDPSLACISADEIQAGHVMVAPASPSQARGVAGAGRKGKGGRTTATASAGGHTQKEVEEAEAAAAALMREEVGVADRVDGKTKAKGKKKG